MKSLTFFCPFIFGSLLFCGNNVVGFIGFDVKYFYLLVMLLCIPLVMLNKKTIVNDKSLLLLLLFCTTYGFLFMYNDRSDGSRYTAMVIMLTPILFSVFPRDIYSSECNLKLSKMWYRLLTIFICFFICETFIASMERIVGSNIFGWQRLEEGAIMDFSDGFRSSALHGHPLYNALIVSTSMAFILISHINIKLKMALWVLGFFSILCFNTRSSIVGNGLLLVVFAIYTIWWRNDVPKRDKRFLFFMVVIILLVGAMMFITLGFGSRLLEMGLFDENSAMARIDVFNIFDYYSLEDFLWGMDYTQYEYAMYYAGIEIVENFYIAYILRNGIVFFVVYILLYFWLIKRLYKGYDCFTKWFTGGAFILIASTNNSLSTLGIALFLFLILIVMFNPMWTKYSK